MREVLCGQNCTCAKCYLHKIVCAQNFTCAKCYLHKIARGQNVLWAKLYVHKILSAQNCICSKSHMGNPVCAKLTARNRTLVNWHAPHLSSFSGAAIQMTTVPSHRSFSVDRFHFRDLSSVSYLRMASAHRYYNKI